MKEEGAAEAKFPLQARDQSLQKAARVMLPKNFAQATA